MKARVKIYIRNEVEGDRQLGANKILLVSKKMMACDHQEEMGLVLASYHLFE